MSTKKDKQVPKQDVVVKKLQDELEMAKAQYLRALADYHNLEKRILDLQDEVKKQATRNLVIRLLTFLDNLDKAEVFIADPGLKIIKDQFQKTLRDEGVEELDLVGKEYNPEEAEAVDTALGERDNIVFQVMQKGYKLFGKVIRPAQVTVTKKQS